MILDPQSDKDKVRTLLKKLLATMDKLQEQAFTYKSYQKTFKVMYSLHSMKEVGGRDRQRAISRYIHIYTQYL